ncbi:hypothetical protein KUCAC02_027276 [Chaenocephalus aceratus]|uniref:Uncharacterized protein n=1 Tax=Chaenocephalus aceratus TaxID=36190 RepID=A0ACB9W3W6_CHAAC|nr:hypothetical protein KUCAC02_027276 [Chaenocephalus aceratus]
MTCVEESKAAILSPIISYIDKRAKFGSSFENDRPGRAARKKGSKHSIQRMKFLESYCEKVLKCDQSVTRTPEVTQFFMPKDHHDLQPDFIQEQVSFSHQSFKLQESFK